MLFDNGFQGLHGEIIRFNDSKAMMAPFVKAADADVEHFASTANGQTELPSDLSATVTTLKISVLLYGVLAKYVAAFFRNLSPLHVAEVVCVTEQFHPLQKVLLRALLCVL